MIESVSQPFGIVSVAGMYRTGKSYLLNRVLLDRSDGFGVGPTINPCTKVSLTDLSSNRRAYGSGEDHQKGQQVRALK